jgi:hypothetical protein
MKKDNSGDELKENEEKWGIGRGIQYGLVPFNIAGGTRQGTLDRKV